SGKIVVREAQDFLRCVGRLNPDKRGAIIRYRQHCDGPGFGEPFELAGAVNVWSLAEDTSGSLWYLAQSRSQLGRIDGDGAMTVFDLPPSFNAIALTARLSRDGVLVAGTTGLLAVGDEVGPVWNVPGAIAIRDLVVSLDGTVWAADTTANAVFKIELRDAP
ncbi:MAG: hypothetical protein GY773_08465, partial [Actinomycetia bacterium]|nr:hypothetical protein [Actinomycetes bacterium]